MSEDSARGLLGIDSERELVGGGHIGHDGLELARRVEALRGQVEIEALGGRPQGGFAVDLKARRDAGDRLAEGELLQGELLDDNLERKLRQDRPGTAVRRRRFRAKRPTQDLHMSDGELIDLEPAAEQRQPVPDEPDLVDFKPGAIAVRKDDVADRGVGGQHAVDRADRDAGRFRGQRPRKKIGEHPLVRLGGARLRAKRDKRDEQRHQPELREETLHHQKACPMLT